MAQLAPEIVELLRIAALIGRTCPLPLLAQIAEQELEAVEGALYVAAQAHLIRMADGEVCTFTHDKIRETLYDEISASRRRRLHSQIGHLLEQIASVPDPQRLANLAFHFVRAGDRDRGISYALQAAGGSAGGRCSGSGACTLPNGDRRINDPNDPRWAESSWVQG